MTREQHDRNLLVLKARRYNWTPGVWTTHNIAPETIYSGFPPKEVVWERGRAVCDPYWKILTVRRSLRYNHTGLSADINSFARRMA